MAGTTHPSSCKVGLEDWRPDRWAPTHCVLGVLALSPCLPKDRLGPFQSDTLFRGFPGGGGDRQGLASSPRPQAQGGPCSTKRDLGEPEGSDP